MTKEEITKFLKENLSIKIEEVYVYCEPTGHKVKLLIEDEIISESIIWNKN